MDKSEEVDDEVKKLAAHFEEKYVCNFLVWLNYFALVHSGVGIVSYSWNIFTGKWNVEEEKEEKGHYFL